MRNYLILFAWLSITIMPFSSAAESIVVVANTTDKTVYLSRQQARNLFMGVVIPYNLKAVALSPENKARALFNIKIVGLPESRIQSYWAQMAFTGRKVPPKELSNEDMVLGYLKKNEGTAAYLPSTTEIPSELTVIYRTD